MNSIEIKRMFRGYFSRFLSPLFLSPQITFFTSIFSGGGKKKTKAELTIVSVDDFSWRILIGENLEAEERDLHALLTTPLLPRCF